VYDQYRLSSLLQIPLDGRLRSLPNAITLSEYASSSSHHRYHHAVRSRIDRRWNRRNRVVSGQESIHDHLLIKTPTTSTIVYNTLVRAGVKTTSALVTSPSQPETGPDTAQCSRGVRIVPDISLSQLSPSSAVCIFFLSLSLEIDQGLNAVIRHDFRENMTQLSSQVA